MKSNKLDAVKQISDLINSFGSQFLDAEITGFAVALCKKIGRMKKLFIERGKHEIWAASIIHAIARINFLLDPQIDLHITHEDISEFFNTKKTTLGSKASQIMEACNLYPGVEGFCRPEIRDMFSMVELENGMVIPKSMTDKLYLESSEAKISPPSKKRNVIKGKFPNNFLNKTAEKRYQNPTPVKSNDTPKQKQLALFEDMAKEEKDTFLNPVSTPSNPDNVIHLNPLAGKIGRNAPCPCGSGKKYKKCCLLVKEPPDDFFGHGIIPTYDDLVEKLLEFSKNRFGENALVDAVEDFLDEDVESEEDLVIFFQAHGPVFFPWYAFIWEYQPFDSWLDLGIEDECKTLADFYLESKEKKMDALEKEILDALNRRPFSFYEVLSVNPGSGFSAKDIFTGETTSVTEKTGSEILYKGDIIFARIARLHQYHLIFGMAAIPFPPSFKPEIIQLRKDIRESISNDISTEDIEDWSYEIIELYLDYFDHLMTPPTLTNTDGDPLLFHTLYYEIDSADFAFDKLAGLCVSEKKKDILKSAEPDQNGRILSISFPWSRKGFKGNKSPENTVLGHIDIKATKMTVEVNSQVRAKKIKAEIQNRMKQRAIYKTEKIESPESYMNRMKKEDTFHPSSGIVLPPELSDDPDVIRQIGEKMASHWNTWIDEPIPALKNKTPRQAVVDEDGRDSVAALLLDAERSLPKNDPVSKIMITAILNIRKKLGLRM